MEIRIRTHEEFWDDRVTIEITGTGAEIRQVTGDQEVTFNTADQDVPGEAAWYRETLDLKAEIRDLKISNTQLYGQLERQQRAAVDNNAEMIVARRRIAELEKSLAESRELVEFKTRVADDIDADRAELHEKIRDLTAKVREYDHDRKTERARADQNKEWAKRTEAELARKTAEWEKSSAEGRAQVERLVKRVEEAESRGNQITQEFNAQELRYAEERRTYEQSIHAHASLLNAATTRVESARIILAAPKVTETRDGIVTTKGAILSDAIGNALAALDA